MNKSPAVEAFYKSTKWRKCRKAYAESKWNLCENCLIKGIIEPGSKAHPLEVHHKIRLTESNLSDPSVSLGWDNLILLCEECHREEHGREKKRRWKIDSEGRVLI